VREACQN